MPQLEGGLTVDEGYREVEAGAASGGSDGPSRSFDPADHRDESLGVEVYGAEKWLAPGMGEPHPDCGTHRVEGVCESCGEIHTAPHQCGRMECPDCWGVWAKELGMKRTKRLQGYRHTSDFKQAAHAVVSFDDPAETIRGYVDDRGRAAEIAKEKGFQAFDVIAHPARITEEGEELIDRHQADDDPRGDHVFLREEFPERYHFGLPNSLLEWAPHYHIIGVTSPDMEPAKDSDPYVYQFFRSLPRYDLHDLESFEAVYGLYRYLLSHVGLHEERNFQTVVGYGGLSNSTYEEYEPEPRVMDKIEEKVAKVADRGLEEIEEEEPERAGPDEEELGECPAEECEGVVINIFRIPDYLEQADPPPNIRKRLLTAYEWRTGKAHPPPGLRNPGNTEQAREAFEAML